MVDNDPSLPRPSLAATNPDLAARIDDTLTFPILGGDYVVELMSRATELAVAHIDGADHAGISIEFDGHAPFTIAPTGDRVTVFDHAQYEGNSGPCLTARRTDTVVRVDLRQMGRLWPDLSITAHQCCIDRVFAAPLHCRQHPIGSLNLYTDAATPATISPGSAVLALLLFHLDRCLADYSDHLEASDNARDLHQTVTDNAVYHQAIGVIAETLRCSRADAADALAATAQVDSAPLGDVAARIVRTRQL